MILSRRQFIVAGALLAAGASRNKAAGYPETIRAGIIGLDGHYSDLLGAAKDVPSLRITAVADPRPGIVAKTRSVAGAKAYTDYRQLLDGEKLDVICVCGQNDERPAILQACAAKRLPIISEKPLAITASDLAAVKRAITRSGAPFTMLLTMRGSPIYQAMREIVRGGKIGEVVSMDAQKSYKLGDRPDWMKSRKTFGGTIPYIGVHMIDLMRWISGRDFVEAAAFQSRVGVANLGDMENVAALAFKMDNGGAATLRMDYQRPATASTHGDDRLRVVGTRGIIEYQGREGLTLITDSEPLRTLQDLPRTKTLCADFLQSIYLEKTHILSLADIFRVSEIVLKTREAAERGRLMAL